jgi:hypothetical protein
MSCATRRSQLRVMIPTHRFQYYLQSNLSPEARLCSSNDPSQCPSLQLDPLVLNMAGGKMIYFLWDRPTKAPTKATVKKKKKKKKTSDQRNEHQLQKTNLTPTNYLAPALLRQLPRPVSNGVSSLSSPERSPSSSDSTMVRASTAASQFNPDSSDLGFS